MKKYLMTGITALAMSGLFTSCTHDMSGYVGNTTETIKKNYENAFVETFGQPAADQDWGFGTKSAGARGLTRAAMPDTPSFRDTNPIQKPEVSSSYKNTLTEAKAAGAKYARDYQNYQKGDIIYIDTEYQTLNNPQNTEDLTIYVDGNVTYCGGTNQNGNGTVICVTENSTLKLGAVSNNLTVYLAPGATLDITKGLRENVISWWPYQSEIVESGSNSFSFQNPHAAIYLNANSTVKATDLTLINGAKLLNDGGTIEASNLTLDQQATLWNEGTIKVTNTLTLTNMSSQFYNKAGKTIEAANLDLINNNALLYNEGTITATGAITLHNTNAEIVNYGTLSGASFSSAAGGKMHNEGTGTVTITGKTDLTNSNSTWMNDGQWTCGSFDVDNYSHSNINNCRVTVNGNFHLNRGTFVLSANSGVVCESFTWEDTSDFYLGSNSVLKINGDLLTKNTNSGYGFRGTGDEYAVIQAARIYHEGNEQFRMSYYGKLLVATSSHFEQWYKDAPNTNQPAYWYESSVKFTKDGDNIATIPATDCNPGYEGGGGGEGGGGEGGGADEIETIRVIAEDLTINDANHDFDFNDVVFDVIWNKTQKKVSIKLLAAGGELTMYIGGTSEGVTGVPTVNELFKLANGNMNITEKTMINTATGRHHEYDPYVYDLDNTWWSGSTIQTIANSIYIRVMKSGELVTLSAESGRPASKIAVGTDYEWCDEREDIDVKFGGKFTEYVGDPSLWNTWYK